MKVKCPSCGAVGKLPADKLPAQGANIRCPSCSYVFFVGGPSGSNLVESTGETGRMPAASAPAPVANDNVHDVLRAAREKAARITQSALTVGAIPTSSGAPEAEAAAAAPATAPAEPAPPVPSVDAGAIPRFDQVRPSTRTSQNVAIVSDPRAASGLGAAGATSGLGAAAAASASGLGTAGATSGLGAAGATSSLGAAAGASASGHGTAGAASGLGAAASASGLGTAGATSNLGADASASGLGTAGAASSLGAAASGLGSAALDPEISTSGRYLVDGSAVHKGTPAVGVRPVSAPRRGPSGMHPTAPATAEAGAETHSSEVSATPAAAEKPAETVAPQFPRTRRWRLRMESGITFDFGDTESVRDWLSGQKSHDGITLQADGTGEFSPIASWPDLAEVRAAGYRTRYTSTAAVNAVRTTGAGASLAGASMPAGPPPGPSHGTADAEASVPHSLPSATVVPAAAAALPPPRRSAALGAIRPGPATSTSKAIDPAKKARRQRLMVLVGSLAATIAIAFGFWFAANREEVRLPETPAGERMEWFIRQINGDASMLGNAEIERVFAPEFLREIPAERVIDQLQGLDEWQSEFRLIGVESSSGGWDLRARLITGGGHLGEVRLYVSDTEPHRVLGMWVRRIASR